MGWAVPTISIVMVRDVATCLAQCGVAAKKRVHNSKAENTSWERALHVLHTVISHNIFVYVSKGMCSSAISRHAALLLIEFCAPTRSRGALLKTGSRGALPKRYVDTAAYCVVSGGLRSSLLLCAAKGSLWKLEKNG